MNRKREQGEELDLGGWECADQLALWTLAEVEEALVNDPPETPQRTG